MSANSQYLKWFHQIEKALWSFFALFGDLCHRCAQQTIEESATGKRKRWDAWCCCMIDNQVHDNWASLNAIQTRFDRDWYDALRRPKGMRTLGNGPCPALGAQGCLLRKCRPITCTTQLCPKMLVVLNKRGLIRTPTHTALQIEDLVALPDILPELYGTRMGRKISASDVATYLAAIRELTARFRAAPPHGGVPTPPLRLAHSPLDPSGTGRGTSRHRRRHD
jgi:hypothetical protein